MLQLYKILTAVLACTGCIGLLISGEINLLMSVTGAALIPGYYRFLIGRPPAPQWVIGGCSVLTLLVFFFDSLFISSDYFIAVGHLTITFQAIKSFDLKEPWDHLQVYFMALLQLIIASEIIYSITFGILFIIFLVVFVTAIIFSHFMKEGTIEGINFKKPILYISLLTLIITVVFFISIPRISQGIWSKGHKRGIKSIGFSEKINLGTFGEFKLDQTIIMRAELEPMVPGPYYWRGMILDEFNGTSWRNTLMRTRRTVGNIEREFIVQPYSKSTVTQKIMLEPIDSHVIFGLEHIISVTGDFYRLEQDPSSSLYVRRRGSKRIQYIVRSNPDISSEPSVSLKDQDRYLGVPVFLKDLIKPLTDKILKAEAAEQLSNLQKAKIIEIYLKKNYRYSLSVNPPRDHTSPILYFLFQSKTGFCEHYATAMTLMLRSAGIPARIVTGFTGGELNTYGGYLIVRQSNAHAWIEAFINGSWERFDPTPPIITQPPSTYTLYMDMLKLIWDRYVIAFSLSDQKEIVKGVSMPFMKPLTTDVRHRWPAEIFIVILLIAAILTAILLVKHIRFKRYGFVTAHYVKLRKILKRRGITIKQSSTPSEIREEAAHLEMNQSILEALNLYEKYRFGCRETGSEERARYQRLVREIKRRLRR